MRILIIVIILVRTSENVTNTERLGPAQAHDDFVQLLQNRSQHPQVFRAHHAAARSLHLQPPVHLQGLHPHLQAGRKNQKQEEPQ